MPTMIVETGAKVAGANSYCSVADADDYHDLIGSTEWVGDTDAKELALIKATLSIDTIYGAMFDSQPLPNQEMSWPRFNFWDKHNRFRESGTIPRELKRAVATLALKHLKGTAELFPAEDNAANIQSESVSVDGVVTSSTTYFGKSNVAKHAGFTDVEAMLTPLLKSKKGSVTLSR
jgi:hypothetical protein